LTSAEPKIVRLFLEALHYFARHNSFRHTSPEQFGNWNSVLQRFDRLGKAGLFSDELSSLAGLDEGAHLIAMCDSTVIRAPVSAAAIKGAERSSARAFTRRVRNKNPSGNRSERSAV